MKTLSALFLVLAAPVDAGEVPLAAPVISVRVFPAGGTYTRRAEVDLPAGRSTILLPYASPDGGGAPNLRLSGAFEMLGVTVRRATLHQPDLYMTAGQAALKAVVEAAEGRVQAQDDRIAAVQARIAAAKARAAFAAALKPPTETAASVEDLAALAGFVQAESTAAAEEVAAAQTDLRRLIEERRPLAEELAAAIARRDAAGLPVKGSDLLAIEVDAGAAGPAAIEFDTRSRDMGWSFDYDVTLDTHADASVTIDRNVVVAQSTPYAWDGVELTLGTSDLSQRLEPQEVYSDLVRADEAPRPIAMSRAATPADTVVMSMGGMTSEEALAKPAAAPVGQMVVDGLAVTYVFPRPVTLAPNDDVVLALDSLDLPAETYLEASPRFDATAYLVAELTNDTGAPILGASTTFVRDGEEVGRGYLPRIIAGDTATVGFGPFEGVRLGYDVLRNETGDRGLVVSRNTRAVQAVFSVENLTDRAQEIRANYALPFSEQEDLTVRVTARPAPAETDIEKQRGVSLWKLNPGPGETVEVNLDIRIEWPLEWELYWSP